MYVYESKCKENNWSKSVHHHTAIFAIKTLFGFTRHIYSNIHLQVTDLIDQNDEKYYSVENANVRVATKVSQKPWPVSCRSTSFRTFYIRVSRSGRCLLYKHCVVSFRSNFGGLKALDDSEVFLLLLLLLTGLISIPRADRNVATPTTMIRKINLKKFMISSSPCSGKMNWLLKI